MKRTGITRFASATVTPLMLVSLEWMRLEAAFLMKNRKKYIGKTYRIFGQKQISGTGYIF